jgi:predicted CoA-binding protein
MSEAFRNPDDSTVHRLLETARRIAVVGLSPKPHRDSNRIGRYLLDRGYEVVPVYPREETILGQKAYRRLQDVPGRVDLVDVFRRSEELAGVVDDALVAHAPALWFQLGCVDEDAARRAAAAGETEVMDRCVMVEHAALLGRNWKVPKVSGGDTKGGS